MRSRRFAQAVGLVVASGALVAACVGAPRPAVTNGPIGFGFGPLSFRAPEIPPPSIDVPSLVTTIGNVARPTDQAPRLQAPAVERFRAAMQESMETTGRCHH